MNYDSLDYIIVGILVILSPIWAPVWIAGWAVLTISEYIKGRVK